MHDLFNPAGLQILEDRQGAVAYGWIAQRVFYGRFVGSLSAELTWSGGVGPAARHFATLLGEPTDLLTDPVEFDLALSNVAPPPLRLPFHLEPVWQVHAPR